MVGLHILPLDDQRSFQAELEVVGKMHHIENLWEQLLVYLN